MGSTSLSEAERQLRSLFHSNASQLAAHTDNSPPATPPVQASDLCPSMPARAVRSGGLAPQLLRELKAELRHHSTSNTEPGSNPLTEFDLDSDTGDDPGDYQPPPGPLFDTDPADPSPSSRLLEQQFECTGSLAEGTCSEVRGKVACGFVRERTSVVRRSCWRACGVQLASALC